MEISPIYHNSRPEGKLPAQEAAAFDFLDSLGIDYERVTHELAGTRMESIATTSPCSADVCKTFFLCNRQKTNFSPPGMPPRPNACSSYGSDLSSRSARPACRSREQLRLAALHAGFSDDPRPDEQW